MGISLGGSTSKSREQSNSSTMVDPLQQEFLKKLYFGALGQSGLPRSDTDPTQGMYGGKLDYYPGQTVADRSQDTLNAMNQFRYAASGARNGDIGTAQQVIRDQYKDAGGANTLAAQGLNVAMLRGDFLNSNPYIDQTYANASKGVTDAFNRSTLPSIQSRFGTSGNSRSAGRNAAITAAQDVQGDQLRRLATDIYGGNYQAERDRQTGAIQNAPLFEQLSQNRADRLFASGRENEQYLNDQNNRLLQSGINDEDYRQRVIDEDVQRFEFNRDEPYNRLARYSDLIGNPISTSIARQKAGSNSYNLNFGAGLF